MRRVILYTDGACLGNPGRGGWAFVLKDEALGRALERSGGEADATNNRMEVMAVVQGFEALKRPCLVEVVSDSEYVVTVLEGLGGYAACGFQKSPNSARMMKNYDLWRRLWHACKGHEVRVRWTRGHVGHPENERCDALATAAAREVAQAERGGDVKRDGEGTLFGER